MIEDITKSILDRAKEYRQEIKAFRRLSTNDFEAQKNIASLKKDLQEMGNMLSEFWRKFEQRFPEI